MAKYDVDLFVIGGGSGGVRAARIAAGYGAKVMLAEEYRMGGTCVIRGCVPKKLFVIGSRVRADIEDAAGFGWKIGDVSFDWQTLVANKDKEISRLESVYASDLQKSGVETVHERAVLDGDSTVLLKSNGKRVTARHILIATGSHPNHGRSIPGMEHVVSSDDAFGFEKLPPRIAIQGGGYIALEFAGIFTNLGCEVTLICRSDNVLRGFDEDIRVHLRGEIERRGTRVIAGHTVESIGRRANDYEVRLSDQSHIYVDKVMFAIGRHPNVAGLGLEAAGVAISSIYGGIIVDQWSRTSVPRVYAVGDVTNRHNLTPIAIREGHAFADTVFGKTPVSVDHDLIPTAVFSQPEVATVGFSESDARAQFGSVKIFKAAFPPLKSTMSGRETRVLMKLIVDSQSNRVLGCHIAGDNAAEIIQGVSIAIRMKATKADFDATFALHPTAAEELVTMRTSS